MTVQVDHSSPAAILRSYQQALTAKDYSALLNCIQPDYRDQSDALLWWRRDYDGRIGTLDELLRTTFGENEAQRFREKLVTPFEGVGHHPYGGSAGSDFSNVQIASDGGRQLAYAVVDGKRTRMAATEVDRKWYVAVLEPKEEFASIARTERLMLRDLVEWSYHVTKGIRAGSITRDNIAGILSLERMPTGMPTRQGVSEEAYYPVTVTSRPSGR